MQATGVTQATTVAPATSNIKYDSYIMTAHNSRKESNSRNTSTVWTPLKAGIHAKTVMLETAWRVANSSRNNRNITASTAEGSPQQ